MKPAAPHPPAKANANAFREAGTSQEDNFIARYFAPIAGAGGLGLRDDAALLKPRSGCELVVTVDTLVAGVHFFADDPPASIARKALRVNLSDLAAKGADAAGFVLSFAMPADTGAVMRTEAWLAAFSAALGAESVQYTCPLLGGDTVTTPGPLTLSVTAFGFVPEGRMVLRTGAKAGDLVFVSGSIGDAALGLQALLNPADWCPSLAGVHRDYLVQRYREPLPRNAVAPVISAYAHGAMDVSDGLAGDLVKMMRVSGVSARIAMQDIPFSEAAQAVFSINPLMLETALTGGDDYEIVCTVAPENAAEFAARSLSAGVVVTRIGEVTPAAEHHGVFVDKDNREHLFARGAYSHF
ncbi:MAG: thiamine-phosphate kinase [Beijerinckiaceae bacterium]|jgi:thiamine-monophosphate kinase|nr:thiamine-phosphate kinase [Beijerinckiaceae bacterium]